MKFTVLLMVFLCLLCGYSNGNIDSIGVREEGDELVYTSFRDISSTERKDISIDFSFRDDYDIILRITQGRYSCDRDTINREMILVDKGPKVLITQLTAKNATYMHCTEAIFGFYKK